MTDSAHQTVPELEDELKKVNRCWPGAKTPAEEFPAGGGC